PFRALVLLLAAPLCGQAALRSPEVLADGRVTFRCDAPRAVRVSLNLEGAPPAPMARDEQGLWRITTAPLAPDVYAYTFLVDGVTTEDPSCAEDKPILTGGHESLVEVPGSAPQPWELDEAPHGALHRHLFMSKVFGETREVWVYTPPGYDAASARTYPTLYLLHGVMEDARAWTTAGRANLILDTLIARKQAMPMVAVFPLGYGFPDARDNAPKLFMGVHGQRGFMDAFGRCLFDEIMPLVEGAYRVRADRASRALAGASMGGAQALYLGLSHPGRFSRIGSFSGAFVMLGDRLDGLFLDLDPGRAPSLWMACGTGDFLLAANRGCAAWLASKHLPVTAVETPGGHSWRVWRRNLIAFAPTLFTSK
ncbi:MAG TPA: alpha/beta hydrolase-fold protein, partial [Holophagaceae bacterium]|nr:alpha/beta hydrolase-fold protein [Holophagaceae bacterium]